jgi:hypothetical protein
MPKNTIYLYVDGCDLRDSEAELVAAFAGLARAWKNPSLLVINDKQTSDSTAHPEDLPEWSLGLNVNADTVTEHDLESMLRFGKDLAGRTGHDFVFGLADQQQYISDDLCFISADAGDAERLMMLTALAKH